MTNTFRDLGVAAPLCDALERTGITHPFPIQELTLPLALAGNDVIGQARTGMGKTLAFGLPLLQRIDPTRKVTQALVVVPTRELCLQVYNDLTIGAALGISSISVYGGVGYDEQLDALSDGAHVVVGTPGRLLDHLQRRTLDLSNVTELVLDEADEMLDMGFLPDVERLVEACTADGRHTMLFSATMPTAIVKLGRRYMNQPTFTRAESADVDTAPTVKQHFLQVHRMDKPRVLARILQAPKRQAVYVFVRTKHMADRLVRELEDLDTPAIAIHGDLRQATREKNLDRFRSGRANVLVATEVAARGLDVDNVTHVVNYDCPDDDKMYLHRIGRTARAGRDGVAVTFAESHETERLNVIRKAVGAASEVVPVFSTSTELTEWFDLPADTPWGHLSTRAPRGNGNGRTSHRTDDTRAADAGSARGRRSPRPARDGGDNAARDGRDVETSGRRPRARARSAGDSGSGKPTADRSGTPDLVPETSDTQPTNGAARQTQGGSTEGERVRTRTRTRTADATRNAQTRTQESSRSSTRTDKRTTGDSRNDAAGHDDAARRPATTRQRDGEAGRGDTRGRSSRRANTRGNDSATSSRSRSDHGERPASSSASSGTTDVEVTSRGEGARGDGQPQLARRVRVEHLP